MLFLTLLVMLVGIKCSAIRSNEFRRRNGVEEYSRRYRRGREMLLDNLKRFHNQEEPIKKIDSYNGTSDFKIPDDTLIHVASYLNWKDLKTFRLVSSFTNFIRNQTINHRLLDFNKYYVFEEQWFNDLMLDIIITNFGYKTNLAHSNAFDIVEYMTLHAIQNGSKLRNQLPTNVYRGILSFFHETIYGVGAFVPAAFSSWNFNFAFKLEKYDLYRTLSYYYSLNSPICQKLFNLVSLKRTNANNPNYLYLLTTLQPGSHFDVFINMDWSVPETMTESEALAFMKTLSKFDICSNEIWGKLQRITSLSPQLRDAKAKQVFSSDQINHYNSFFKKLSASDCVSYIESRDINNLLDIDILRGFQDFDPKSILFNVCRSYLSYFVKLDAISKLIRSRSFILTKEVYRYRSDGICITEFLLMESPRTYVLPQTEPEDEADPETEVPQNNPLALLLLRVTYLPNIDPEIIGKYNLNVSYRLNYEGSGGILKDLSMSSFKDRTMTFRRILETFPSWKYAKDFGLYHNNRHNDFIENQSEVEYYPIYSLKEYLEDPNSIS